MNDLTKIAMFVVGAVVLFGATAGLYWEQYYAALQREGLVTTGTVSQLEVLPGNGSGVVAHFEFPVGTGKVVQSRRSLSPEQSQTLREGSRVAIRYLPKLPRVHEIVAFSEANREAAFGRWLQYVLLLFIGAGVIFWVSDAPRLTKRRMNLSLEDLGLDGEEDAARAK